MYAFYLNETLRSSQFCTVPVINMKRADLSSHVELKWLLDSCDIDQSSLVFVDEVCFILLLENWNVGGTVVYVNVLKTNQFVTSKNKRTSYILLNGVLNHLPEVLQKVIQPPPCFLKSKMLYKWSYISFNYPNWYHL